MQEIKLKPEFAEAEIGFNGSAKPLGERKDLDHLLILAHRSGRQDYLDMFDNPPSLQDLLEAATDKRIGEIPETTTPLGDNAFPQPQSNIGSDAATPAGGGTDVSVEEKADIKK